MTTKDSNIITDFESTPQKYTDQLRVKGNVVRDMDAFELATTDLDASDIVHLTVLPANAVVHRIALMSDDLDTNGTPTLVADVGLYTTGGTAKDDDAFASAVTTLQAATTTWQEVQNEALDIASLNKKVYEHAGDSDDSEGEYYLSLTFDTGSATAAAGTLAFLVEYTSSA